MTPELREYLLIVEDKLRSLIQDITNIRARLEQGAQPVNSPVPGVFPGFFSTLPGADLDFHSNPANMGRNNE